MSNKPKVSIVVPVYKSEKYIRKCLDSLLSQSLKEIEIVCVNDGSPDSSLDILKEYEKNSNNVVVIDKKNEGVWKARIDGIKKASGEYIGFLDSDDYVDYEFAEKLYKSVKQNGSDIAVCGFKRIDSLTGKTLSKEMGLDSHYIIDMKKNPEDVISLNTALWNKIYKASILKSIKEIENPPRILEDMMFLSLVYLSIKKISFVDDFLYNYMVIPGSAMNTLKEDDIKIIKSSMIQVRKEYMRKNVSKNNLEILSCIAFLHFGASLMLSVFKNDKKNFKKSYCEIVTYLNEYFPEWRSSRYLNMIYTLRHKRVNFKVAIIRKVYKCHMFRIFLEFYSFITKILKIDIKW